MCSSLPSPIVLLVGLNRHLRKEERDAMTEARASAMMEVLRKVLTGRMSTRRYSRPLVAAVVLLAVATSVMGVVLASPSQAAVQEAGTPVAWGDNDFGHSDVPSGLYMAVVDVAGGNDHSLALKRDGTVVAWGDNSFGQSDVPSGLTDVVDVSAGLYHSLAVTTKIDTTAPSVSCSATPNKLRTSANNHKLVTITASVNVTDNSGGLGGDGFSLVSVTSNQADGGLGKDDVPNDIQGWTIGAADTSGQLRAERYGKDRVYTLTYRGKDLAGNTGECQATVRVPKG
jgi:Regulator of chromosome condensation (RCC1) repeat